MASAARFHGHLGPYLALGVRIGVAALRELGAVRGDRDLSATVALRPLPPLSCLLDGVQVVTGCTLGNGRLTVRRSNRVVATFKKARKRKLTILVDRGILDLLRTRTHSGLSSKRQAALANVIMAVDERKLLRLGLSS